MHGELAIAGSSRDSERGALSGRKYSDVDGNLRLQVKPCGFDQQWWGTRHIE
jgi:hypothetical protein